MGHLIIAHPAAMTIALYWIFSAFIGGMPPPDSKSSAGYTWLYGSLHIIAGNVTSAFQSKFPNIPAGSDIQKKVTTETNIHTPDPPPPPPA